MKNKNICRFRHLLSVLAACLLMVSCAPSFKKGYKAFERRDYPAAISVFQHFEAHPKWGPAAQYYSTRIRLSDTRDLPGLLALDHALQQTDSSLHHLPLRLAGCQARKYGVDSMAIASLREQTQRWAIAGIRARGTLPALDSLLDGLTAPLPQLQPDIEDTHRDIVNANLETADYDTMTAILRRHIDYVLSENYDETRRMSESLWTAFTTKYPPCAIDRFAREHPMTFAGRDCWLSEVHPLLCEGSLGDLLDFHGENRWTALEIVVLNRIAGLAEDSTAAQQLDPGQQAHLLRLKARTGLRSALHSGNAARDTSAALGAALEYIRQFAPRYSAFRMLEEALQFFLEYQLYSSGITLLEQARPFFPDTLPEGCTTNFNYQHRVKPWIDGKLPILRRPPQTTGKRPLTSLNTPEGEEFNPVVRADAMELFFAGRGRRDNLAKADVFTATWDTARQDWTSPRRVPELSGAGQQIPLSLTADGKQLLLQINGRLYLSRRAAPESAWSVPEPLPVSGIPIMGSGQLSADGNILVLEGAYSTGSPTHAPDLDIFVSLRDPATGTWGRPAALGADINTDGQETSPFLLPDGRTLYYTSTEYPGLGSSDVFMATRTRDDWTHWSWPKNMGKELNDTFPHRGYTTVSADGKRAWMSVNGDLWEVQLQE